MPSALNRVCNLEDWRDPDLTGLMVSMLPYLASQPGFPHGHEHRKHWEYAHVVRTFERLGAVHPEAWLLSVAGGHEEPAYYLTNRARWVFVTDLYGTTGFSDREAHGNVLLSPDHFAPFPYNRNRLVVQYMNAWADVHGSSSLDEYIARRPWLRFYWSFRSQTLRTAPP